MSARDLRVVFRTVAVIVLLLCVWAAYLVIQGPVVSSGGGTRDQYCGSGASIVSPGYCR
jgi:hypothetical protein